LELLALALTQRCPAQDKQLHGLPALHLHLLLNNSSFKTYEGSYCPLNLPIGSFFTIIKPPKRLIKHIILLARHLHIPLTG